MWKTINATDLYHECNTLFCFFNSEFVVLYLDKKKVKNFFCMSKAKANCKKSFFASAATTHGKCHNYTIVIISKSRYPTIFCAICISKQNDNWLHRIVAFDNDKTLIKLLTNFLQKATGVVLSVLSQQTQHSGSCSKSRLDLHKLMFTK